MSDTKPFKAWLAELFYSASTVKPQASSSSQKSQGLSIPAKCSTRPVDIIQNLREIGASQSKGRTIAAFTRQNSTGCFDTLSTSTYPPTKTDFNIDEITMGNTLKPGIAGRTFDPRDPTGLHFNKILRNFHGKLDEMNTPYHSSLPCGLNSKVESPGVSPRIFQGCGNPIAVAKFVFPVTDFSIAVPNVSQATSKPMERSELVITTNEPNVNVVEPIFACAKAVQEINIMSKECFKEVQMHSKLDPIKATPSVTNIATSSAAVTEEETQKNTPKLVKCKNPLIARIMSYEPDSESDFSADEDSSSFADEDFSESSFSDSDLEDGSDLEEEDLADMSSDYSDEDTDSDEQDCPWERIISCRVPWTCNRSRTQVTSRKSSLSDNCSSQSSESSDTQCTNSPDMQTSYAAPSVHELSTQNKPPTTVKRPTCSNSHISFILGCPESDCEEDGDDLNPTSPATPNLCEDANELWAFFTRCHEKLTVNWTTFNKSHSDPQLFETRKNIETKESQTHQQPQISEDISYKAPSKVRFMDKVVVHPMVAWSYAYREARKGRWDSAARDRHRFGDRVRCVGDAISWCFNTSHRGKIYATRMTSN
nr:protein phosphatase 1 regulatory subunit 15A-like [Ciona intestinalis]|eukprot:XP_002128074.1 protein phosphatase 1 regulatory subunit 15A-like [Ciona intestinalis]